MAEITKQDLLRLMLETKEMDAESHFKWFGKRGLHGEMVTAIAQTHLRSLQVVLKTVDDDDTKMEYLIASMISALQLGYMLSEQYGSTTILEEEDNPFAQVEFETRLIKDHDPDSEGVVTMAFTGEAKGTIPNGTRIEKCNTETSDSLADGDQGVVMSSMKIPEALAPKYVGYCYHVLWDKYPSVPVMIQGKRIKEVGT